MKTSLRRPACLRSSAAFSASASMKWYSWNGGFVLRAISWTTLNQFVPGLGHVVPRTRVAVNVEPTHAADSVPPLGFHNRRVGSGVLLDNLEFYLGPDADFVVLHGHHKTLSECSKPWKPGSTRPDPRRTGYGRRQVARQVALRRIQRRAEATLNTHTMAPA
jgi:hypothetical protein